MYASKAYEENKRGGGKRATKLSPLMSSDSTQMNLTCRIVPNLKSNKTTNKRENYIPVSLKR